METKEQIRFNALSKARGHGVRIYTYIKLRKLKKMAKIDYKRNPCTTFYSTPSGPVQCKHGALKGKEFCARHQKKRGKT